MALSGVFTGATLPYSTANLPGHTGDTASLRRAVDNAVEPFTEAELRDGTALAWVGAGDAYWVTFFGQNGAFDLTQATAGSQTQAVSSGAWIVTQNGLPGVRFNGTGNYTSADGNYGLTDAIYTIQVVETDNTTNNMHLFHHNLGTGNQRSWLTFYMTGSFTTNLSTDGTNTGSTQNAATFGTFTHSTVYIREDQIDVSEATAANTIKMWLDGSPVSQTAFSGTAASTTLHNSTTTIRLGGLDSSFFYLGDWFLSVAFPDNKVADRADIYAWVRGKFFGQPVETGDIDTGWEVTGMTVDQDLSVNDIVFGEVDFGYDITPATIDQVQRVPLADVDTGWEITPMTLEMDSDNVVPLDDLDYGWEVTGMILYQEEGVEIIPEQPKAHRRSNIHLVMNGEYLDLPMDLQVELEMLISNPGELSVSQDRMYRFVLPVTPKNFQALGLLPRMSTIVQPESKVVDVVLVGKTQRGKLTIWKANRDGIDVSIGMGVYALEVMDKSLREVDMGTVTGFDLDVARDNVNKWYPEVNYCLPTIVAPNYYGDRYQDEPDRKTNPHYRHVVNHWNWIADEAAFGYLPNYIDDTTYVTKNENAIVPQVFLVHVLKSIFAEARLDVGGSWIAQQDVQQLWVWNNRSVQERVNRYGAKALYSDIWLVIDDAFNELNYSSWEVIEDIDSSFDDGIWTLLNPGFIGLNFAVQMKMDKAGGDMAYGLVTLEFYDLTNGLRQGIDVFKVDYDGQWHTGLISYAGFYDDPPVEFVVRVSYEAYDEFDAPIAYGDHELQLKNSRIDHYNLSEYNLARIKGEWNLADYVPDMKVSDFLLNVCGCANLELLLREDRGVVELKPRNDAFGMLPENWEDLVLGQPEFEFLEKSFLIGFEKPKDEAVERIRNMGWMVAAGGVATEVDVDSDEGREDVEDMLMEGAPFPMAEFTVNVNGVDRKIVAPFTRYRGDDEVYELANTNDELRMMMYRGRKVIPFANYMRLYEANPAEVLGEINWIWNAQGEEADYTLYALYWKQWLRLQTTGVKVNMPVLMTAAQLNRFDMFVPKYMMAQVVYLTRMLARVGVNSIDAEVEGIKG